MKHELWTQEELETLIRLRSLGLSYKDIAERMVGRSFDSVQRKGPLARAQLNAMKNGTASRRAWGRGELRELKDCLAKGMRLRELSEHFNLTPNAIYHVMQRHGLETGVAPGGVRKYDYEAIGEMADNGATAEKVAKTFKCSVRHAGYLIRKLRSVCPCCKRKLAGEK